MNVRLFFCTGRNKNTGLGPGLLKQEIHYDMMMHKDFVQ